jgi:hypothetical protein
MNCFRPTVTMLAYQSPSFVVEAGGSELGAAFKRLSNLLVQRITTMVALVSRWRASFEKRVVESSNALLNRVWMPLAASLTLCGCGSTAQMHGAREVFLERSRFGDFMNGHLNQVAGVILLDLLRTSDFVFGEDSANVVNRLTYPCTVLLNPNADRIANPDWFPRARVLTLEGDTFHWVRGAPPDRHSLPSGTRLVPRLPED